MGFDKLKSSCPRNVVPVRFVFDTNIYDRLLKDRFALPRLVALQDRGDIEIFKTHVQKDEFDAIRDEAKRRTRLALYDALGTEVPTEGAIWDVSKWDQAKWGSGSGDAKIEDVLTPAGNNADALLAVTASCQADVFVTEDRRLSNRVTAQYPQVQVWTFDDLAKWAETTD